VMAGEQDHGSHGIVGGARQHRHDARRGDFIMRI
jgi:hypothetical protein